MKTYTVYPLTNKEEADYASYVFSFTIDELITMSHSSNIQRLRNPQKEEGIMKFIKDCITKKKTPFFQPFILHHEGDATLQDNRYVLTPTSHFMATVETNHGPQTRAFAFEVIDGNGRLNAMIRLKEYYLNSIQVANQELETFVNGLADPEQDQKEKRRRLEDKVYKLRMALKSLKYTQVVIQLYVSLNETQKIKLFKSVNQGEQMSQGRLKIYETDTRENELLKQYIQHTEEATVIPYKITPDKDRLRSAKERETFIPAVLLLPVLRKLIKYAEAKDMADVETFVNTILDLYIAESASSRFVGKPLFSILGTVIETAMAYDEPLAHYVTRMLEHDMTPYTDLSKRLKPVREAIVATVFETESCNG